MIIVNIDYIPDKELKLLGLVKGSTIHTKHLAKEVDTYSQLLNTAREQATSHMISEAKALGADAIINVRYSSSSIGNDSCELLTYGTAVKFKVRNDLQQF